jgi:fumarate hydratase class II
MTGSGTQFNMNVNEVKAAALQPGFVREAEFDRVVDPRKMVKPYVAIGG